MFVMNQTFVYGVETGSIIIVKAAIFTVLHVSRTSVQLNVKTQQVPTLALLYLRYADCEASV